MEPVAVAVAAAFADVHEGSGPSPDHVGGDALGHEEDLVGRNVPVDPAEEVLDLFEVTGRGDDELELEGVGIDPGPNHLGLEAEGVVLIDPAGGNLAGERDGVGQFRAERSQIAGYPIRRNGGGGLDGEVLAGRTEGRHEFVNALGHQGLSPGDDGVMSAMREHFRDDLVDRPVLPLGLPGGVFGVAPTAPQIAAGGADKDRRDAGQLPLALDRIKDLGDPHGWDGLGGSGPVSA